MKRKLIKCTIFALLIMGSISSTVFAEESTIKDTSDNEMQQIIKKSKNDSDQLIKKLGQA